MDTLYHRTNRIIQEIQILFQNLNESAADTSLIENDIQTKIASINANCDRMDVLLFKVPAPQRPSSKMKIDQLKYDNRHLLAALENFQQKRKRKQIEISEREQLLSRRFAPNSETSIDIDYSLQHHNSMHNAHQGVDDMILTGNDVLGNLRSQREKLKGTHKRLLDIGNTLGLSNQTMKMIERRVSEDKYVMFGGMIVVSLIVFLIIYYFVI